jgi:hypothetical protein
MAAIARRRVYAGPSGGEGEGGGSVPRSARSLWQKRRAVAAADT